MMSLARSARFGLLFACSLGLAGCAGASPPETFDLTAASPPARRALRAQLVVREPLAALDLDSQRILVRTGPESVANLAGAQWSDRLPALMQARLVQTFENAHLFGSVGRSSAQNADYNLELDIRAFELDVAQSRANADVAVRIVSARSGRIVAAQIFKTQAPAEGTAGAQVSAALNAALGAMMTQIVAFVAARV